MKTKFLFFIFLLAGFSPAFAQVAENDNGYLTGTGFNSNVTASAIQADGKCIVGGGFTSYNGTARNYIVRLNTDGTNDAALNIGTGFNNSVLALAIQSDGKIVAGGSFTSFNGTTRNYIARINTNGSIDATFVPAGTGLNGYVDAIAIQADGKIVAGGNFTTYNGTSSKYIVRLNANGTLDGTFTPGTGFNTLVRCAAIQPDGKILAGGDFASYNGTTRNAVARLNSDGSIDATFTSPLPSVTSIFALAVQPDGKILAGGYYAPNGYIYRFSSTGITDGTFTPAVLNSSVQAIALQPDGRIVLGGWFTKGVKRITASTGADDIFVAGNGFETGSIQLNTLALQSDGKVIGGGVFTSYNGISRTNIARLGVCSSVTVTTQPTDKATCVGITTSFSLAASGTGLTYKWQINTNSGVGVYTDVVNNATYSGATTPTLTITAPTVGMNGYRYRCIVSDVACSSTSLAAILTVNTVQAFTAQPTDKTVCQNASTVFSATLSGSVGGYQWQEDKGSGFANVVDGGIYSGATTTFLSLNGVTLAMNNYKYRLVASLCSPPVISNTVTLTVNAAPVISVQPVTPLTLCTPATISYSVAATGPGLTYQWQYALSTGSFTNLTNGGVYSGVTTATLTLTNATTAMPEYINNQAVYRCVVAGTGTCTATSSSTTLYLYAPPVINTQPVNVSKCAGTAGNVTFSVSVTSPPAGLTYQWQLDAGSGFGTIINGTTYSGVLTPTLTIFSATVTPAMNGYKYRCVVGTCSPGVVSNTATLTVNSVPVITSQPVVDTVCAGMNAYFSVAATGTPMAYQWQVNSGSWTNLANNATYSGVTAPTLTITSTTIGLNGNTYRCVLASGVCGLNSGQATLVVRPQPTFTVQPVSKTICVGQNIFFATAANNAFGTYQWQTDNGTGSFSNVINNAVYSGAKTSSLTVTAAPVSFNNYKFRCVAGSCSPSNFSDTVVLKVDTFPVITSQPVAQTICQGDSTSFIVKATGSALTYQWQTDSAKSKWTNINSSAVYSGVTNDTLLLIVPATSYTKYKYRCIIKNGACQDTSAVVLLKVDSLIPPTFGVVPNPTLNDPAVPFSISGTAPTGIDSLYWDFGDTTTLSGNAFPAPTHTYTANGTYTVCLVAMNSCDTAKSCTTVTVTGVGILEDNFIAQHIQLAPTITDGHVFIKVVGNVKMKLTINDVLGRTIYTSLLEAKQNSIDLSASANGIYYFTFTDGKGYYSAKVLLKK